MKRLCWWLPFALVGGLALVLLPQRGARAQQILQYGFEARGPVWVQGGWDAPYKEVAHRLTDEHAHGGQRSEHIRTQAEKGTHIYYTFPVSRAPVTDDLHVSLWIMANRPGVQLFCRVVLPRERDSTNVGQPMRVLLRCEPYQSTRWKKVVLRQPVKRLREQQQMLRLKQGRDVVIDGAYVDQLVLNVYDGPGLTDVYVDDLEIGPLSEETTAPSGPAAGPGGPSRPLPVTPAINRRAAEVRITGANLLVSGQRFFVRGIRHTGTPLKVLRDAGFNTVWLDESTPDKVIEDAVNLGFWLVPEVRVPDEMRANDGRVEGTFTSASRELTRKVARFLPEEAVLCWDLGRGLTSRESRSVAQVANAFRSADPGRPLAADVWDGFRGYARGSEPMLIGVHRYPLMTSLDILGYRDWLLQKRRLAPPDTFCWTWVQTHVPESFLTVSYEGAREHEPIGPQAEQVRLLAYTAVGCGYRGLAFWSDRFLLDSHTGRDRLLALAQLNQELQMLEPILLQATNAREPVWVDTNLSTGAICPDVKAAVIHAPGAVLALPIWMGKGTQFVPSQAAVAQLSITVPSVPATAQAWEVLPGRVQALRCERVLGGMKVTLHNFSLTSAVLFTSDLSQTGLVVRLQDQQRRMAKDAAQWAHDQALEELLKVEKVHAELKDVAPKQPDAEQILVRAREALRKSAQYRRNGEHGYAYAEAQVAQRAARILMRAHWDRAVRELDSPVSSPYAVSFYTLPRHWRMAEAVRSSRAGANALPGGDFEAPPDVVTHGWTVQEADSLDGVTGLARRVADAPKEGKQCLMLELKASPKGLPPQALERSFLAVHSPPVRLPPGSLVRISAWVKLPAAIRASPDGALLYDSSGGEPLALRFTEPTAWKKFALYRRVPASGEIQVTLALSGLGKVYFDDVRVEPLAAGAGRQAPQQQVPPARVTQARRR
jgi:hypothetical protein